jgi:nucleoside-diphosphate-sugar epimerase
VKAVFITGVTGFLGSHLARRLVREGWEVHGLKRVSSDLARLSGLEGRITLDDVDRLPARELFATRVPEAVVHLATCYGRGRETPSQVAAVNTAFPLTLLEEALARGVRTFLTMDTCYTLDYGHLQAYTLSKRQFAEWGQLLCPADRRFVNLRLFHPYGPRDDAAKFVPGMIKSCLTSQGVDIELTPGEQRKDFLYVDDFLSAVEALLRHADRLPGGGQTVECGSGQATSIREFVETVHRLTRSRAVLRFGALPYRPNEIMFSQADTAALRDLGWRPAFSLEQGLRAILREDFGHE